MQIVCFLIPFL